MADEWNSDKMKWKNTFKSDKTSYPSISHNQFLSPADTPNFSSIEKVHLLKKFQSGFVVFFQSTTIHGVVYLARRGLHIIER